MKRYALNDWFFRVGRTAYRLERATATGAQFLCDEDYASLHYEEGGLTQLEQLSAWWRGFRDGRGSAGSDGHPWFELAAHATVGDPGGTPCRPPGRSTKRWSRKFSDWAFLLLFLSMPPLATLTGYHYAVALLSCELFPSRVTSGTGPITVRDAGRVSNLESK